ncbi:MAG: hypothetical protein RSE55_02945 [Lachnospiraceae bacterium]
MLKQYETYLKKTDVDEKQIITINFEDLEFEELLDYKIVMYKLWRNPSSFIL